MPRGIADGYRNAPIGTKVRVHCCGQDRSLVITRGLECIKYKCFRCSEHGVIRIEPTMQELMQDRAAVSAFERETVLSLPDLNYEFPSHAVVWLSKSSITPRLWKDRVYWCPSLKRVLMPLYWQDELEAVCTRDTSVPRPKPKYFVKYKANFCSPVYGESGDLVIVEDVLSAIRVADAGYRCMCILGTQVNDTILMRIKGFDCPVHVWLDPDKAGRQGRLNLVRALTLMQIQVHYVQGNKDPKYYSRTEIQRRIDG